VVAVVEEEWKKRVVTPVELEVVDVAQNVFTVEGRIDFVERVDENYE
jgi:hypothetical protein